jgi:hypothetical protein
LIESSKSQRSKSLLSLEFKFRKFRGNLWRLRASEALRKSLEVPIFTVLALSLNRRGVKRNKAYAENIPLPRVNPPFPFTAQSFLSDPVYPLPFLSPDGNCTAPLFSTAPPPPLPSPSLTALLVGHTCEAVHLSSLVGRS